MMRDMKQIAFLLALILFTGCVPKSDFDQLKNTVKELQTSHADTVSQLSMTQERLREIQGQLEEMGHKQTTQIGTEVSSLKEDLQSLRRRIPPPPIVPSSALEQDENAAKRFEQLTAEQFDNGFLRLREGKFAEALSIFTALSQDSSSPESLPLAFFWLGVTHDGLSEYRNSLADYNEVVSRYKNHYRAPLSLLRQAGAIEKLGDPKAVQAVLKKLIAEYPTSPEARIAKTRVK